ncbi:recombinase family protein [Gordonia sp. (in: high G+C Gram-positive bacteria)]|uniref:recombinase family protein n=1 Tax=Gordonia sp. (in: high G+C Gram-positive bacteria) TaxID=84139 RepID=UPI002601BAE4|nr:recombinase family protein [Gordonia sp. (in: high G+C Gram-positive bacteria)]
MSRAYGWDPDGHIIEAEAAILRAAAADVADGRPVTQIVRDLNERGVVTAQGNRWSVPSLTRILRGHRMTGRGVDRRTGDPIDRPDVDAILTIDEHARVLAVLEDPERKKSAPKRQTSPLAGIVQCGREGGEMERRGESFRCRACGSSVQAEAAEAEVAAQVLARICSPLWRAALAGALSDGEDGYREEIRAVEHRIIVLAEEFGGGACDEAALTAGVAAAKRVRERAEYRLALVSSAAALDGLSDEGLVQWWAAASPADRRALVRIVVDRVEVLPVDVAEGTDRIVCRWR